MGGKRFFDNIIGKGHEDEAHDGPARVVKPGDWGAVKDGAMKGFSMSAFTVPGRTVPKPDTQDVKLAAMAAEARKAAETHRLALEKAVKQGELAAQAAFARGREEGLLTGEKTAAENFARALEHLQNNTNGMLETFSREKGTLFLEFEGQVLELVSGCLHRVFEGIAAEHTEAVLPLLKRAIVAIGEATSVTIKVHSGDFQTVESNRPYWLTVNASLRDIRVVADDRISKGGCLVESDATSVTAIAQEMADRIDEELKKVFMAKVQAIRNERQEISGERSRELPPETDIMEPGELSP